MRRRQKKVLSLVLCVAMMLSVMVVGAGAAFSDQSAIKNTEAVDACTALNIIGGYPDGSFKPEGNITRAEVTKMICVALNGGKEPAVSTNTTPTFSDVRGTGAAWAEGYIESCAAQGIVSGVGAGKFAPAGNVTGVQLAKMLLVALGYKSENEGFTGNAWATNVNVRAAQKGLYKGLEKMDTNAAISRDNAAQMVWNALNAYEVEYKTTLVTDKNGQLTSQITVQDRVVGATNDKITLMEDKYEAETYVATFNGNYDTGDAGKEGYINVGGRTFPYDLDLKYIGEEVKVLYKDETDGVDGRLDSKDTIYGVYVTGETTVYNVIKDDIQKVTASKIKFNDVEHDWVAGGSIVYNYGAKDAAPMTQANLSSLEVASGDTIKFIENDNGKIARAYVVESSISKLTAVSASKISIQGVGSIEVKDNTVYDKAAKDDVVVYTKLYKSNKDDATFVVTKADTVTGKVKSFNSLEKVNIDGTSYSIDETELVSNKLPDLTDNTIDKFENSNLEKNATLYLINGFVGAADSDVDDSTYALVTDVDNMNKVGNAISGAKVQLLTLDGKTIYDVDEDSKDNFTTATMSKLTGLTAGTLVKYSKVSDTSVEIKAVVETKVSTKAIYDKDTKQLTVTDADGKQVVAASDAVFFSSTDGKGNEYKAYKLRSLGNISTSSNTDVYYALNDDKDEVVAAFADLGNKPSGSSSNTEYGMVISVEKSVKIDDSYYNKYIVWTGAETTIYVKSDNFEKGDYIYFDKTSDDTYSSGEVKKATTENHATVIWTVKYDQNDKLLTYKETSADTNNKTKAVEDDLKIVYVNRADKKAGTEVGIGKYDEVTKYANAIMVDEDNDGKIDAIIVDENNDILDMDSANVATTTADLKNQITEATTSVLNTIKGHGLTVVADEENATVTITGTKANIQNYVMQNTGLFNALRSVPNFKEATFKVNSQAVTGKLLPEVADTTETGLWNDLKAKNTEIMSAADVSSVTTEITVVNNAGTTVTYTIVMNITD